MKKKALIFGVIFVLILGFTGCDVSEENTTVPPIEESAPSASPTPSVSPTPTPAQTAITAPAALSNKTNGWGFKKNSGGRPEFTNEQIRVMSEYDCLYMSYNDEKNLYLTFDEGYENGYTELILDTLKKTGVKAAFFITAPYLKNNEQLVGRMVEEGHIVGNHTVNHPSLPSKSDEDIKKELEGLDKLFYEKFGQNMKYLRAPMGEYSERTLWLTQNMGYINVFWSFAYRDWETDNQKGTDYAFNQVMDGMHSGAVILLHAVSKDNANALESIITSLQEKGYCFKTLDEYK